MSAQEVLHSKPALILLGILGLALLMVVHEGGHLLAARAFGMRVTRFSIGFGPSVWRWQPTGSPTTYQVALIPFLAYVQIAGMNPMEEVDPEDRGSYANASLLGRIVTIFAGPFANYLFASVLFFGAFAIGGDQVPTTRVKVVEGRPAHAAAMKDGDRVVSIDGVPIADFGELRRIVLQSPGKRLEVEVERDGQRLRLGVVPEAKESGGAIGVEGITETVPLSTGEAARRAITYPAWLLQQIGVGLYRIVTAQEKAELTGPIGIVNETSKAASRGGAEFLAFLGFLSTYLAGFNLIPFPALDGGRLAFLGYEAVTRRRPNARVEAYVHFVGLVFLLSVLLVVSFKDLGR